MAATAATVPALARPALGGARLRRRVARRRIRLYASAAAGTLGLLAAALFVVPSVVFTCGRVEGPVVSTSPSPSPKETGPPTRRVTFSLSALGGLSVRVPASWRAETYRVIAEPIGHLSQQRMQGLCKGGGQVALCRAPDGRPEPRACS